MFSKKYTFQILILLHILIGALAIFRSFVLAYSLLLLLGFFQIITSKNKLNLPIYWCSYAMSAEVLFRMTKGAIFYEYIKYISNWPIYKT